MAIRRHLTRDEAFQKARHYCAYQERSHSEVREKLYGFGLFSSDVEGVLAQLIADDYLNEERFAALFAGGKFRQKKWGRKRIVHELRLRKVSEYNIRTALREIDPLDYQGTLYVLAVKKRELLVASGVTGFELNARVSAFLTQKGYESDLIRTTVMQLDKETQ